MSVENHENMCKCALLILIRFDFGGLLGLFVYTECLRFVFNEKYCRYNTATHTVRVYFSSFINKIINIGVKRTYYCLDCSENNNASRCLISKER